ncbi:VWA domain-containing protein [Alkalimarinus alittae]|uniref:VWA domain-containing protein n=1 Tax=Alkalimarinus alittae TaxID=2961619 RepID=A0ABY6MZT3_9ALTE|nr:VWA domain-containing protein [Alkalimarinus alittae]UZE95351.1 VWA domain-containing protein [Alkalimarinus alittae]
MKKLFSAATVALTLGLSTSAFADSIDPVSYSDTLSVGESVTITKTVIVNDEAPSTGLIDVMFLMDTSGSMGSEINQAKAAIGDIISGLGAFGDVATGVGYFSDPGSAGVLSDLSTTSTDTASALSSISLCDGGCGGDFPEEGIFATYDAATNASWRPGSTRFIIALSDANFKESDGVTLADTKTALNDEDITFIGINYGSLYSGMNSTSSGGIAASELSDATGGSIIQSSGLDTADLVDDITDGVTAAFENYSEVSVGDLGAGLPGVDVSVTCLTADTGTCVGDTAVGDFDRELTRTFTYEVTFTALEEGVHAFDTCALVDGGCVATEADTITVRGATASVSEPGTLALMLMGFAGLGLARRRTAKS